MIQLQSLTGMRPGELCIIRSLDIDTAGKTWKYRPAKHKTQHHEHERIVDLGPKARAVLEKYLEPDLTAYLFSPAEAAEALRRLRHKTSAAGDTGLDSANVEGERAPGDHYTPTSYRRAIARACAAAFPPPNRLARQRVQANGRKKKATRWETRAEWRHRLGPEAWAELRAWERKHRFHPHQLRHTAATRWRKEFGSDAALVLLGDRTTRMIDVYAEKDREKAAQIMERIG